MSTSDPRPSVRIENAAAKVEATADSNWRLLRWLLPVLFLNGVMIVATLLVIQNLSDTVDTLDRKVTRVDAQVTELGRFVDELQKPPSAEERAQSAAVSAAVRLVPEIKALLCEQFPQATACRS